MKEYAQRQLDESLKLCLVALRKRTYRDSTFPHLVAQIVAELGKMPAASVVWVERQVAAEAYLYGSLQRPKRLLGLLEREPEEQRALRAHPQLALIWQFHRNGYIREMALRAITTPPDNGFFLAALFARLNDWAEPVRLEAERCLQRLLPQVDKDAVLKASSYLLGRQRDWRRWNQNGRALLDALMCRPDVLQALFHKFHAGADGPLASQMRSLLHRPNLDRHLAMLAKESRNPGIRVLSLKTLLQGYAELPDGFEVKWIDKVYGLAKSVRKFRRRAITVDADLAAIVAASVTDPLTAVRRVAADILIQKPEQFPLLAEHVEVLLRDRNASVRERADFLRRRLQKETPAQGPGLKRS